ARLQDSARTRMRRRAPSLPRWSMPKSVTMWCVSLPGPMSRAGLAEADRVMVGPAVALPDNAPHLLVVDDDRRIRDLLSRFLFAEGYRVTTADNAADARAKLESLSFDLLVLDVMMPGETGFQLAKSLRESSA